MKLKNLLLSLKLINKAKRLSREGKIEQRLLNDASKRKARYQNQSKQSLSTSKNDIKNSQKSNAYAYKVFERDYKNALEKLNKTQNDTMNLEDLFSLMVELQMIDTKLANTEKSDEERTLLKEIWRLLGGESPHEQIEGKSIRNFVCIILNFDK